MLRDDSPNRMNNKDCLCQAVSRISPDAGYWWGLGVSHEEIKTTLGLALPTRGHCTPKDLWQQLDFCCQHWRIFSLLSLLTSFPPLSTHPISSYSPPPSLSLPTYLPKNKTKRKPVRQKWYKNYTKTKTKQKQKSLFCVGQLLEHAACPGVCWHTWWHDYENNMCSFASRVGWESFSSLLGLWLEHVQV